MIGLSAADENVKMKNGEYQAMKPSENTGFGHTETRNLNGTKPSENTGFGHTETRNLNGTKATEQHTKYQELDGKPHEKTRNNGVLGSQRVKTTNAIRMTTHSIPDEELERKHKVKREQHARIMKDQQRIKARKWRQKYSSFVGIEAAELDELAGKAVKKLPGDLCKHPGLSKYTYDIPAAKLSSRPRRRPSKSSTSSSDPMISNSESTSRENQKLMVPPARSHEIILKQSGNPNIKRKGRSEDYQWPKHNRTYVIWLQWMKLFFQLAFERARTCEDVLFNPDSLAVCLRFALRWPRMPDRYFEAWLQKFDLVLGLEDKGMQRWSRIKKLLHGVEVDEEKPGECHVSTKYHYLKPLGAGLGDWMEEVPEIIREEDEAKYQAEQQKLSKFQTFGLEGVLKAGMIQELVQILADCIELHWDGIIGLEKLEADLSAYLTDLKLPYYDLSVRNIALNRDRSSLAAANYLLRYSLALSGNEAAIESVETEAAGKTCYQWQSLSQIDTPVSPLSEHGSTPRSAPPRAIDVLIQGNIRESRALDEIESNQEQSLAGGKSSAATQESECSTVESELLASTSPNNAPLDPSTSVNTNYLVNGVTARSLRADTPMPENLTSTRETHEDPISSVELELAVTGKTHPRRPFLDNETTEDLFGILMKTAEARRLGRELGIPEYYLDHCVRKGTIQNKARRRNIRRNTIVLMPSARKAKRSASSALSPIKLAKSLKRAQTPDLFADEDETHEEFVQSHLDSGADLDSGDDTENSCRSCHQLICRCGHECSNSDGKGRCLQCRSRPCKCPGHRGRRTEGIAEKVSTEHGAPNSESLENTARSGGDLADDPDPLLSRLAGKFNKTVVLSTLHELAKSPLTAGGVGYMRSVLDLLQQCRAAGIKKGSGNQEEDMIDAVSSIVGSSSILQDYVKNFWPTGSESIVSYLARVLQLDDIMWYLRQLAAVPMSPIMYCHFDSINAHYSEGIRSGCCRQYRIDEGSEDQRLLHQLIKRADAYCLSQHISLPKVVAGVKGQNSAFEDPSTKVTDPNPVCIYLEEVSKCDDILAYLQNLEAMDASFEKSVNVRTLLEITRNGACAGGCNVIPRRQDQKDSKAFAIMYRLDASQIPVSAWRDPNDSFIGGGSEKIPTAGNTPSETSTNEKQSYAAMRAPARSVTDAYYTESETAGAAAVHDETATQGAVVRKRASNECSIISSPFNSESMYDNGDHTDSDTSLEQEDADFVEAVKRSKEEYDIAAAIKMSLEESEDPQQSSLDNFGVETSINPESSSESESEFVGDDEAKHILVPVAIPETPKSPPSPRPQPRMLPSHTSVVPYSKEVNMPILLQSQSGQHDQSSEQGPSAFRLEKLEASTLAEPQENLVPPPSPRMQHVNLEVQGHGSHASTEKAATPQRTSGVTAGILLDQESITTESESERLLALPIMKSAEFPETEPPAKKRLFRFTQRKRQDECLDAARHERLASHKLHYWPLGYPSPGFTEWATMPYAQALRFAQDEAQKQGRSMDSFIQQRRHVRKGIKQQSELANIERASYRFFSSSNGSSGANPATALSKLFDSYRGTIDTIPVDSLD